MEKTNDCIICFNSPCRCRFINVAKLVKTARVKMALSQDELSKKIGYKNGQFISNIERSLCSVPLKNVKALCTLLDISPLDFKQAYKMDQEVRLTEAFK